MNKFKTDELVWWIVDMEWGKNIEPVLFCGNVRRYNKENISNWASTTPKNTYSVYPVELEEASCTLKPYIREYELFEHEIYKTKEEALTAQKKIRQDRKEKHEKLKLMKQYGEEEEICNFKCGDCIHHRNKYPVEADGNSCKKRIDHDKVKYAKPYFKCYDCQQFSGYVCSEFYPRWKQYQPFDFDYWIKRYDEEWMNGKLDKQSIGFVLNNDVNTRYYVNVMDYIYNRHIVDGYLKATSAVRWTGRRSVRIEIPEGGIKL